MMLLSRGIPRCMHPPRLCPLSFWTTPHHAHASTSTSTGTSTGTGGKRGGRSRIKTYSLQAVQTSAVATESQTADGHAIASDLPRLMGGQDGAPQPVYLLLASLVGCEHATAAFVARHMKPRIHLRSVSFDIHAERDERGAISLPLVPAAPDKEAEAGDADAEAATIVPPARLQRVYGVATVDAGDATQEQVDLLARLVHQRCPVANMVTLSGCELDIQWRLLEEGAEGQ